MSPEPAALHAPPRAAPTPVGPLREVVGPTALGGGFRRFLDLLWLISVTEFRRTYFGTVLGYLWSLIRPLALFGILLFVFTNVFKAGSEEVEHYPVMLLMGVVLYAFFQEATTAGVQSVVAQEGIVRKTQFPRLVIPLTAALTAFFNLCLNLVIVLVFTLAFGVTPAWTWFLFPFAVAALAVLTAAVCMALSVLFVRFRDVAIIWVVAAQVLFYGTPILYPVTAFTDPNNPTQNTKEHLLMLNPLAVIFEQVRVWVLHEPDAPSAAQAAGGALHLIPAAVIFIGVCVFGVWIFNREAPRVAENL
jgi:ABC-2 type transport system permease protein